MLTHGPPLNILDQAAFNSNVGCGHLRRAVERVKPRLHCFGHIHEGYGCQIMNWDTQASRNVDIEQERAASERGVFLDASYDGNMPIAYGHETMFINAAIMNLRYRPENSPWVVTIELPAARPVVEATPGDQEV